MLDAAKNEAHKTILTRELEAVGLRLNKAPPQIHFKRKKTGGISFSYTVPLTHVDEALVGHILRGAAAALRRRRLAPTAAAHASVDEALK